MGTSADGATRRWADEIKTKLFYQLEYREMLTSLLRAYNPVYNSRLYLINLIAAAHVYHRLLRRYSEQVISS